MGTYPRLCPCCREAITTRNDHRDHITRHQSEISSLVNDFCYDSDEDCEPRNDVMLPVSLSAPLAQEPGTKIVARRTRLKNLKCSEKDCTSTFTQLPDLERHRFKRMVLDPIASLPVWQLRLE